jgi:hypothetical protein
MRQEKKMKKSSVFLCTATLALALFMPRTAFAADYSDQYLIEDLCRQMEAAYESLDTTAVVSLYHDISPRGVKILDKLFERSDSVSVDLEFKEMNQSKTEAVVLMKHISLVHKWCRRKLEAHPHQEYHVKKSGGVWKFVTK